MLQLKQLMHKSILATVASAFIALSTVVFADDNKPSFVPHIPEPENGSTECVEPEDEMKKNHMVYIMHQRDKTMYQGIRTKTYSLKECINCHVPQNTTVRYGNDKHFCSSCHNFAGVSIDCFQCHADRPQGKPKHSLSSLTVPHYADTAMGASNE